METIGLAILAVGMGAVYIFAPEGTDTVGMGFISGAAGGATIIAAFVSFVWRNK